ncbi:hypothetical protein C2S52_022939 [Perilla frutescens var. hirtella]|nr:hypothetical protein C2S52_022939 [Perilla frutescens var. hirtella]
MAEASAKFLLNKIDNFVSKELSLHGSIKERINELKSEHEMITQVLKGADALTEQDNQLWVWIKLLRNIDYEIENVVYTHAYQNCQAKNVPCVGGWPRMSAHSINNKIEEIQTKLKGIKRMKAEYLNSLRPSLRGSNSSVDEPEIAPLNTPEKEMVGVEGPRKELVSWANDAAQAHRVMFVVGMGGSGKTALVKLVYEQLKADFDCHVWLTASRYEHGKDLLSDMYSILSNQRSWTYYDHTLQDLITMLSNYLGDKRYLIVLDNWNRRIWGYVKYAFPKCNRSRVMITTRRGDIASSSRDNSVDIYKIPPLPFEEAETLFCRRAFPESLAYPPVPAGLHGLCENLLRECEGLPHGIIEMGKLLAYTSESQFKILGNGLQAELKLNSGRLSSITRVLLSSYNELPYHLKCCFLYMSMFPKEHPVKRRMLVRMWIAEDFINGMSGKEPEDIGEEYLEELMERNLVQASELEFDGKPQTCRVHNLMHKIAISESEAQNFCSFTHDTSDEMRRLSIQDRGFNMPGKALHHVRTFVSSSSSMRIPPGIIPTMKLLKILHLDHANVEALPSGIKDLLLLKYLSLCNTRIKQIPSSTARLKLLQTLNLKQTFVTGLPESLVVLEKLRHLLVSHHSIDGHEAFDAVQGFKVPKGISKLTNLQKLSFVKADRDHKLIRELQNLTKLRKLGIIDLPSNSGPFLSEAIQTLRSLRSLSMKSQKMHQVLEIQEIDNPPQLQRLYLWGRLEKMPHWISKLLQLVRIRLKWSRLEDDSNPITILGELPSLLELQLLDAYTGNQFDFCAGAFLKLKILEFNQMERLQMVMIGNGALPCLQKLTISLCQNLRKIPTGIASITQLKELHLSAMPPDFVNPLKKNGSLHHLIRHIKLSSRHLQNGKWVQQDMS